MIACACCMTGSSKLLGGLGLGLPTSRLEILTSSGGGDGDLALLLSAILHPRSIAAAAAAAAAAAVAADVTAVVAAVPPLPLRPMFIARWPGAPTLLLPTPPVPPMGEQARVRGDCGPAHSGLCDHDDTISV